MDLHLELALDRQPAAQAQIVARRPHFHLELPELDAKGLPRLVVAREVALGQERDANATLLPGLEGDALEALVSLGYNERDAREALKRVPKETEGASERVKAALKLLSQHA